MGQHKVKFNWKFTRLEIQTVIENIEEYIPGYLVHCTVNKNEPCKAKTSY